MQEDLEVTGISRSGRVRKKSSKLMDFESPDDIETRYRRQTPVKSYTPGFRHEDTPDFQPQESGGSRPIDDAGTASGSESDYYENTVENADSMESDSSASDEGSTRTPANSLYMMEKNNKKKLIIKDGRVIGRAKAQRKDKGKTRITAYMMWAKEARNELLRKHPDMDFSAISKRLGEMWSNVNYNERYLWKRKAKRFAMQKEQSNQTVNKIISNPKNAPSAVQVDVLLAFLRKHRDLANGKLRHLNVDKERNRKLWNDITGILNSMPGCTKTREQWRKVWRDKKYLAKRALSLTSNLPKDSLETMPFKLDEQVLSIIQDENVSDDTQEASITAIKEEPSEGVTILVLEDLNAEQEALCSNVKTKSKPSKQSNEAITPTEDQMDVLLTFMSDHPDLANNRMRNNYALFHARKLWNQITNVLNSMPGSKKSTHKWQRVWRDKKYNAKRALLIKKLKAENGTLTTLSKIDQRVLCITSGSPCVDDYETSYSSESDGVETPTEEGIHMEKSPSSNRSLNRLHMDKSPSRDRSTSRLHIDKLPSLDRSMNEYYNGDERASSVSSQKSEKPSQASHSRLLFTPDPVSNNTKDKELKVEIERNKELAGIKDALKELSGLLREAIAEMKEINNKL